jgi:hypothetical protein
MPRVARLHISGAKQLVGPPLEHAVPGPSLDERRLQLLGQLAKPVLIETLPFGSDSVSFPGARVVEIAALWIVTCR